MITADHESVVMQQIRRERFRQFCEGFGSLRSPCRDGLPPYSLATTGVILHHAGDAGLAASSVWPNSAAQSAGSVSIDGCWWAV